MKFGNYQFPHPVLTNFTDDIAGNPTFVENIIEKDDSYTITIDFKVDNEELVKSIDQNLAGIICEVNCSGTVYRNSFKAKGKKIFFELPKFIVRGKIEFSCYLVSFIDIVGYTNSKSHPDYDGFSFDIESGDILAYFGEFSFNATINYKKLKAVSSFLKIEERSKIDITEFDIDNDRIIVKLPEKDFSVYKKQPIAKNEDFAPIFHASIVLSALLFALQSIDKYEDKMWAQVIKVRLKEDDFKGLSLDEEAGDLMKIAQKLLGNPVRRLLTGLDTISEKFAN
jgi:hypothetical protein